MIGTPLNKGEQQHLWPERWVLARTAHTTLLVLLLAVAVFFVAVGISMAAEGNALGILLLVLSPLWLSGAVGVYMLSLAARTRGWSGARHLQTRTTSALTALPSGRAQRYSFYAVCASAAAPLAVAPVLANVIPDDGSLRSGWFQQWGPFMPVFALGFAVYLLSPLIRRRRRPPGIGLGPEGIYHWSWLGCCVFSWEWISTIRPTVDRGLTIKLDVREPSGRADNAEENWFAQFERFRRSESLIRVGYLTVNPALAYYALCYYHRHPERRDELGTEAALDRMRRLDFPDVIGEVRRYGEVRMTGSRSQ